MKAERRSTPKAQTAKFAQCKRLARSGKRQQRQKYLRPQKLEQPKVCSSEFWEQRGAQVSYGNLQDEFHEQVGWRYGLERGEVGSSKKHTTKYQWQKAAARTRACRKSRRTHTGDCTDRRSGQTLQDKNAIYPQQRKIGTNTIPRRHCGRQTSPRRRERHRSSNANASV